MKKKLIGYMIRFHSGYISLVYNLLPLPLLNCGRNRSSKSKRSDKSFQYRHQIGEYHSRISIWNYQLCICNSAKKAGVRLTNTYKQRINIGNNPNANGSTFDIKRFKINLPGLKAYPFGLEANLHGRGTNPSGLRANPHGRGANPCGLGANPYGRGTNPSGLGTNPYRRGANPSGLGANPHGRGTNPSGLGANLHKLGIE